MEDNIILGAIIGLIEYLLTHSPILAVVVIGFFVHYGEKYFRDWCVARGKEYRAKDGQPTPAEVKALVDDLRRMFEEYKERQTASDKANSGEHKELGKKIEKLDERVDEMSKSVAKLEAILSERGRNK